MSTRLAVTARCCRGMWMQTTTTLTPSAMLSTVSGSLLEELAAANKKQEELRQTVERQQCYISGLEYALRHMTPTVVVESHEKGAKEKAG